MACATVTWGVQSRLQRVCTLTFIPRSSCLPSRWEKRSFLFGNVAGVEGTTGKSRPSALAALGSGNFSLISAGARLSDWPEGSRHCCTMLLSITKQDKPAHSTMASPHRHRLTQKATTRASAANNNSKIDPAARLGRRMFGVVPALERNKRSHWSRPDHVGRSAVQFRNKHPQTNQPLRKQIGRVFSRSDPRPGDGTRWDGMG